MSIILLCFALVATVAALPASPSTAATTLLQSSNANLSTANALTFRKLTLAFSDFGGAIPEKEVEDTLRAADQAIEYEVKVHPEQRMLNNQFTYRRADGNMLIFIRAAVEEELTWKELSRVLQAVFRFMTGGVGILDEHYQALEFEVQTPPRKAIGFGLIHYFPDASSQSQKRASQPPSSAVVNTTTALSARIRYSVPNSPVILTFTSLGEDLLPSWDVEAGLTNALRKISYSVTSVSQIPILGNRYWYRDNVSNLWISIRSRDRYTISWQELNWTLTGLLHSMKDDICRELVFDIEMVGRGKIASGRVGHDPSPHLSTTHPPNSNAVEKHMVAPNGTVSRLHGNATNYSTSSSAGECTTIADMGVKLCFRSFGPQIPAPEVNRLFNGALYRIRASYGRDVEERVPNNFFQYEGTYSVFGDTTSIAIQPKPQATILWTGLWMILESLWEYMKGMRPGIIDQVAHYQVLEFDLITSGNAKMGTGWVRHRTRQNIGLNERRTNSDERSIQLHGNVPSSPSSKRPENFAIPGTDLTLVFLYYGDEASSTNVVTFFDWVLLDLPSSEDLLPGNSFHFRTPYTKDDGGTSININWISSYQLTYDTLHKVLLNLQIYLAWKISDMGYWQDFEFELNASGTRVGSGILWYVSGKGLA